jgi:hypothetical protein
MRENSMVSPVWMDGPFAGKVHEVSPGAVEQGMYQVPGTEDIYTFALVEVFQRRLVIASVQTGIVDFGTLFARLLTAEAQQAAQ